MNRTLTFLAAVALIAVGCKSNSNETALTVKFAEDHPEELRVRVGAKDTTFAVTEAVVKVTVPADITVPATAMAGESRCRFISDGTKVTLDFSGEKPVYVGTAGSLNGRMSAFQEKLSDYSTRYREMMMAIRNDASMTEEEKNAKMEEADKAFMPEFMEYNKALIAENPDNILGVSAYQNIYSRLNPEEMEEMLNLFSPEIQETSFIKNQLNQVKALSATAEGKMFTDFEVKPDEKTKLGKNEKFSDYIGKGKYVLVDFWASWCGPCKGEIPNLKEVYAKYHGDQFDMLSVAVWDEPQASLDTAKAYGIPWNHMINAQKIPTDIYGIGGIPHIILFGPDGTILKRDLRGAAIGEEVAKYVKK